jgi:hypothetical protein
MGKDIRLIFKTVKSPELIIYSKGRFKEFSLIYKNSLNSLSESELVSSNSRVLEAIEVLTISMDNYLFSYNKYDGFTYVLFLSIIDSMIEELKNLDNAIMSKIITRIYHDESFDLQKIKNHLRSFFNGKFISVVTEMNDDKCVNYDYTFLKIHIKLNTYELK